ncbi:hypothetical protein [Promicromonospora kroppenstedtii]|uniref:hypothetical protein n=1 Tax=Promicromonospora kroppenstedtii TaxID=440482 RepID=UPI0004B13C4B|nr:hypothetical protein [Promicromonospora kroppenstedtii]
MSHDDLNDRTDRNDFLSGALHGAADAMPGGEVNDLHVSFPVVRDRVRRRRAVKVGSLAGASLVMAGVLAFGVTQSPVWDREPVLPGTPSENVAPNRSADPTGEPSSSGPPATSVIQDGYQPSWIKDLDAGLSCGMPAEDLETTAQGWTSSASGDIYAETFEEGGEPSTSWGMSALVSGNQGSLNAPPVLVWSQDGVVVDLGPNAFEGSAMSAPLLSSEGGDVTEAQGGAFTTCAPVETETNDTFQTLLPAGDYEVRVVAFPQSDSGQWETAVSEPVAVRLDADGAHSPTGTRGGAGTIEPPEPAEGELTRFELDRTTDWVSAKQTQRGYVTTGTPAIRAQCESLDPDDVVRYEVMQSNESFASGEVPCNRSAFESGDVIGGAEEAIDIRLTSVPDGVTRFWATLAPKTDDGATGGDAAGACSADGLGSSFDPANAPSEASGATAEAIVDAALACDQDRLVELATEYPTELLIPAQPAEQVFALPEDESLHYLTLVGLLTGTVGADQGAGTYVWPRVATDEFRDSDEAWQEVVDAGVLTPGDADAQRAEGFGYTGMRIAIDSAGNWRYYSATP